MTKEGSARKPVKAVRSGTIACKSATPCAANASWTGISGHTNWFDTGEVYQSIDPLGHSTTHTYDPFYVGAYSTQTCSPTTNGIAHCVSGTYDFNTGLLRSFTDQNASTQANGNTPGDPAHTATYSYDQMLRMTSAVFPADSSGNQAETDFSYPDVTTVQLSKKLTQTPTAWIVDYTYFDGLGRTKQTQLVDPEGDDFVDTTYDAVGRVATVSNSHRSSLSSTDGTTQMQYDALGRVTQVTKQDGSISATVYSNFPTITVTDEAGKRRRSRTDALGRLIEVDEPGAAFAGSQAGGALPVNGVLRSQAGVGAKAATGSVTVTGAEQSNYVVDPNCIADPNPCTPTAVYDGGYVYVSVNGQKYQGHFGINDNATSVANQLAAAIRNTSQYVDYSSIVVNSTTSVTINLVARNVGASGNYPLSCPAPQYDNLDFASSSFSSSCSGPALTGGSDGATVWDSGTVTVTIGNSGFTASAPYSQSSNNTGALVATALVGTGSTGLNRSGSPVSATNNGASITLTYNSVGVAGNVSVTAASSPDNPNMFPGGSFSGSTTLSNGQDPDPSGLTLPYVTLYSYDALGNLTCAVQKGLDTSAFTTCGAAPAAWRPRSFTYDSLSQLLTATNPESGTICYGVWVSGQCVNGYDANGNLVAKTDARGITTSYSHDALNRLTQKSFSNGDPTLVLSYDSYSGWSSGSSIGRLVRTGQVNSLGHYFAYDPLGRISSTWQCLPSDCTHGASVTAQYNLAGGLTQLTYPNGQKVTFTPNSAGRDVSAIDTVNKINFATAATYSPDGALAGFVSGNSGSFAGITNSFSYNNRLQPVSVSASSPTQTVLSLSYDFHAGAGDNGNVFAIVNNKDTSRNQAFTYDQLNRLISAQNAGTDCTKKTLNPNQTEYWGNSYTYDAWGNLLAKTVTKCSAEYLSENADTQNRMHVTSGPDYSYDAAGNMTYDATMGHHYAYDGQSQITQVDSGATATYTYDAEGHRVRKDSASSPSTEYVYFGDDGVAEKNVATGAWTNYVFFDGRRVGRQDASGVAYYFSDHLKTADVITDLQGNIKNESDYYPWGGELSFLANDSNHYKFTGKERDVESGLDYFGARYYSNGLGRFVTPDWSATPVPVPYGDLDDPQSLNQYSYVRNLPTTKTDADGHCDATGTTNCSLWDHVAGVFGGLINIVPETANIPTQIFNAVSGHFGGPQLEEEPLIEPGEHASRIGINLGIQTQAALPAAEVAAEATTARMVVGEVRTATAGTATEEAAAGAKGTATVQTNRAAGNAFRDELAAGLKAEGKEATKEVTKQTPFGRRVIDIEVKHNGKPIGGIEAKVGKSPYKPSQRAKDAYLKRKGYPVNVVRKRAAQE